jgi:TPR repeat protein
MRLILILTALLAFQSAAASEFDDTKALADQGMAAAQYNLGNRYYFGEGVPENNIRAYVWWSMAKTQGYTGAVTNIDILKPKMTPQQIADGQALASKCYESNYKDCD